MPRSTSSNRGAKAVVLLAVLVAMAWLYVAATQSPAQRTTLGDVTLLSPEPVKTGVAPSVEQPLVISDAKAVADQEGRRYVIGTVTNKGSRPFTEVSISVFLYGGSGVPTDGINTTIPGFGPGESGKFEVQIPAAKFTSYRVRASSAY